MPRLLLPIPGFDADFSFAATVLDVVCSFVVMVDMGFPLLF
jgi:hypothetical protein